MSEAAPGAVGNVLSVCPYLRCLRHAAGVASLSAAVQRGGGSKSLPGTQLDEALEQIAAYIEVRAPKQKHTTYNIQGTTYHLINFLNL